MKRTAKDADRDRSLFYRATMLRAHCIACRRCKDAVNHQQGEVMCPRGVMMAALMAAAWTAMVEFKKAAGPNPQGLVYACPDPALHGESYHLCAELYSVNGVQPGLF